MLHRLSFRLAVLALIAIGALTVPAAHAQFRGGYAFIQAVENRDGNKATEALQDDATLVNTRHPASGETALAIVTKRRDLTWLRFLLSKGGDPSIDDRQGMTPLMHAALIGFPDGAEELLKYKAPVDQANRRGETALILAVQARHPEMVRLLVKRGANPDIADHIAGLTARDYAKRNDRSGRMDALLEIKPDAPTRDLGAVFGPK